MRVKWLQAARINLDQAIEYISLDDPMTASQVYNYICDRVDDLAQQPNLGRPGRVFGTRELVLKKYSYIIPYSVHDDEIQILRVFHTSQSLPHTW